MRIDVVGAGAVGRNARATLAHVAKRYVINPTAAPVGVHVIPFLPGVPLSPPYVEVSFGWDSSAACGMVGLVGGPVHVLPVDRRPVAGCEVHARVPPIEPLVFRCSGVVGAAYPHALEGHRPDCGVDGRVGDRG